MNKPAPSIPGRRKPCGSALLLVMWAMVFMSLAVFGVVKFVAYGFDDTVAFQKDFRARQLAESGLAIGLHPEVRAGDPVLQQELPMNEKIKVRIRPEDGRLPINALLLYGHEDVLRDLFEQWGLEPDDAATVVDSLADWVDRNNRPRLRGAEREYYQEQGYPDYPRNKPFESVDEMLPVRGMDKLAQVKPHWKDYFTVYGSGKLNVNGASAEAIAIYTKMTRDQAAALVRERNGPDGIPDTEDDLQFTSLEQFRDLLGLNPIDFDTISPLLTVETTLIRVESRGTAGGRTVRLSAIASREYGKRATVLAIMAN